MILRRAPVSPFLLGMIYSLSLRNAGIALGLFLIVIHALALLHSQGARELLRGFPRSRGAGFALLALAAVWAFWLVSTMDLGEFSSWRRTILIAIVASAGLMALYVQEFLAVRALGFLALLAAEPLLEAAFLQPEPTRLLVSFIGYAWALLGLFWVGMPYLLRDQLAWVSQSTGRWKVAALGGLVYGVAVLFCAFTRY